MTSPETKSLVLWDSRSAANPEIGPHYSWNGYGEPGQGISLLRYVDTHGDRLRAQYCQFTFDLAERRLHGKTVAEHLAIENGFSFWWMTSIVERSLWKSPVIADVIRLLALEEIVGAEKPQVLRVFSANKVLCEVLGRFCEEMGIAFEWRQPPERKTEQRSIRRLISKLPHCAQALLALARHLSIRWPLRQERKAAWSAGDRSLLFCSYFDNVDAGLADQGHFHSHYWGPLPGTVTKMGIHANWLQLFVPTNRDGNVRAAQRWLSKFNRSRHGEGCHAFLDAYLSPGLVLRVLTRWLQVGVISLRLKGIKGEFRPRNSRLSLWPLLREDWHSSLRGVTAMNNHLNIALFDQALRDLPRQHKGFYLSENQGWERAFIHAWRKHGHGELVAVPHSTRSYWDLRFYYDPRAFAERQSFPIPTPDLTIVNGRAAKDAFLRENYPRRAIRECEALRYGYLNAIRQAAPSAMRDGRLNVLVLGEFLAPCTARILKLLELALPYLASPFSFIIKPHPNCPVLVTDYPKLRLQVTEQPLGEILNGFHVAYTGNTTSAAVDAFLAGVPLVCSLDPCNLNLSPLRGYSGVCFVDTPEELAASLSALVANQDGMVADESFFFFDDGLARWRALLAD